MRFLTTVFLDYTYPGLYAGMTATRRFAQRFKLGFSEELHANETNFYSGEYTQTSLAQREFFRI